MHAIAAAIGLPNCNIPSTVNLNQSTNGFGTWHAHYQVLNAFRCGIKYFQLHAYSNRLLRDYDCQRPKYSDWFDEMFAVATMSSSCHGFLCSRSQSSIVCCGWIVSYYYWQWCCWCYRASSNLLLSLFVDSIPLKENKMTSSKTLLPIQAQCFQFQYNPPWEKWLVSSIFANWQR